MLAQLDFYGGDAGSNFNDGEDVNGWFGWSITDDVLTVTLDREDGETLTARWQLERL